VIIRREQVRDHDAVRVVHRAAFRPAGSDPDDEVAEARLVDELRTDPGFLPHLSLVAVTGDTVVGHVLATRGRLDPLGHEVLGLGPLGVAPEHQRQGVGTALVHAVLAAAEARGEQLVALLGSPDYYRRFGFRPATDLGVEPPDPRWGAFFQARRLGGAAVTGRFRYAAPFDGL
jgi:putative acetyltransferase